MSKPTRGMVAGQPIKTTAQTREWDEGFERTFGERKPVRGRFVYTSGGKPLEQPVHVNEEWKDPGLEVAKRSEEEVYGHAVATDGTDISTKRRHREYCERNNLTMASDFTQHWEKAEERRRKSMAGELDIKERKEAIGRALHEARRKGRR